MSTTRTRYSGWRGLVVTGIGVSHFIWPQWFDSINRLGFPENPRRFVYINGTVETTIGLLMTYPPTRKLSLALSAAYVVHLGGNVIRAQLRG